MRVTMRHTYYFRHDQESVGSDLVLPQAWDAARDTIGPFGLPGSRLEWERAARQPMLEERAKDIVSVARRLNAVTLCSYGVGTGMLEFNIHLLAPDLGVTCTDYAPRATKRLASMFPEGTVVVHDLTADAPPPADLHLMHRIDTELDTATWQRVLGRYFEPVLLVPVLLLDIERILKELYQRLARPSASRAGWVRTEDALRALWAPTHVDEAVTIGAQRAFLLTRRAQ